MTTWAALLDAMDEGLAATPPVAVDLARLPPDLGVLPPALAGRAATTLRRMAEAEAVLERHLADLARELAALSALATAPAVNVPHFLDTKA